MTERGGWRGADGEGGGWRVAVKGRWRRGGLVGADLSLLLAINRAHLHVVIAHQRARRLPRGHGSAARGAPRRIALDEPDRVSHQPPLPLPLAQRRHELGALEQVRIEGELVGAPARLHAHAHAHARAHAHAHAHARAHAHATCTCTCTCTSTCNMQHATCTCMHMHMHMQHMHMHMWSQPLMHVATAWTRRVVTYHTPGRTSNCA